MDLTTGFEDGILRLQISNATETSRKTLAEFNTSLMHTQTVTTLATATPTSVNDMIPLPEQVATAAGEDSLLQLLFKTQTPTTTVDACNFSIGVTIYQ